MAHRVTVKVPVRELGKENLEVHVRLNGKPLGRLLVSKGGVEWAKPNAKKAAHRASWLAFAEMMESR